MPRSDDFIKPSVQDNDALAFKRLNEFMADAGPASASRQVCAFSSEGAVINAARRRMRAKLRVIDQILGTNDNNHGRQG